MFLSSEKELAINVGARDGVNVGMVFRVLSNEAAEIIDPETGENLGEIDREKVQVKTVDVQEKFSICKTFRVEYIEAGPLYGGLVRGLGMETFRSAIAPPQKIVETLRADEKSFPPPLSEEESYVKKGDRVIQVFEDK